MKRDWEVIRELLVEIEQSQSEEYYYTFKLPTSDQDQRVKKYHVQLLFEAQFITGICSSTSTCWELINVQLTWEGQDLLAHLRSSTIWEKIKEKAVDKGFDLSFEAVTKIATTLINTSS